MASDVMLTNCKVVQVPPSATTPLHCCFADARPARVPSQQGAVEIRADAPKGMTELPGMTAVIIGMGGIGTQIAQRAHAFGMDVIGVDPRTYR